MPTLHFTKLPERVLKASFSLNALSVQFGVNVSSIGIMRLWKLEYSMSCGVSRLGKLVRIHSLFKVNEWKFGQEIIITTRNFLDPEFE